MLALHLVLLLGRILVDPAICDLADDLEITEIPEVGSYMRCHPWRWPRRSRCSGLRSLLGLSTIVVEENAPGGQAGTSSKIVN
jgi:hypothetical protein